jgi:hypothetical protein
MSSRPTASSRSSAVSGSSSGRLARRSASPWSRARAEIVEALHRGDGILSVSEMSRLAGVTRQEIYKIIQRGGMESGS